MYLVLDFNEFTSFSNPGNYPSDQTRSPYILSITDVHSFSDIVRVYISFVLHDSNLDDTFVQTILGLRVIFFDKLADELGQCDDCVGFFHPDRLLANGTVLKVQEILLYAKLAERVSAFGDDGFGKVVQA